MTAATVGIYCPAECHAGGWRDLIDNRLGVHLVERHAAEAGGVERPGDRVPLEQGRDLTQPGLPAVVQPLAIPSHSNSLERGARWNQTTIRDAQGVSAVRDGA